MSETVFKPEALVPIWVENTGISALEKMAQRPVLIELDSLGKTMRGQMMQLTMSGAVVLPNEQFLIWNSLHVKVSFRFNDVVYNLTGLTFMSEKDLRFRFEFDNVTRKSFIILSKNLGEAGLLDAADVEQILAAKSADKQASEADSASLKKSRLHARLVRHEPPPGGKERRIHHRYDIEANAKLAVVNSDCNLECTVLELSLGGCRVHTELPSTIELGTQVEVQFVSCGYPLRMPAKIQGKHGDHILGLKYLEMSTRIRERLKSLIWEVAEDERGSSPELSQS
jgi:hypothetical protein